MGVAKFCVGAFLLVAVFRETTGLYEKNPFLTVVPPVPNVVNPVPGTPGKLNQNIQPISAVFSAGVYPQNPQNSIPAYNNAYYPGATVTNLPPFNQHNPFLNPQQPFVGVAQPSLSPAKPSVVPAIPPVNPQNPFLNPQQPPVGVAQPPLSPAKPSVVPAIPPVNPQNPFLNPQQPPVGVAQPPLPLAKPSVVPAIPPVNPQNPFLNPQQPLLQPAKPPVVPVTIPPINPQNPFLNPQQAPVGVAAPPLLPAQPSVVPVYLPSLPVSPAQPPQPQSADNLRRRCLQPRGQFPGTKCNKFVNCWEDLAVEQFCPEGLAFNPAGFCDYAYNVDCLGTPYEALPAPAAPLTPDIIAPPERIPTPLLDNVLPTTPIPPSYLPSGSVPVDQNLKKKCLGVRGLFASDYCNRYVNCWDGNVVEQDCPPGLLFSSKGYCDFAYNVDCYNRATPVPQPPASSVSPTNLPPDNITPKPPQNGIAPTHPTYRPPLNGATGGTPTPPPYAPLGDLTDQRLRKKCLGERGLFPSYYCHKFVNCWDKFVVEQECPAGLYFSDKGYCDYAYNVNCYNRTVITISLPQPPASPAPPTNLPPDSLKPKPPQPEVVAPPTYRPPLDGFITLPTQTNKPSAPETTTAPTYVPPGVVPDGKLKKKCLQLRGQFPSDICNKYVNCWDGYAVEQDCPPGLLFSEKGYCDYAYNVNCKNRTIITIPLSQPTPPPSNGQPIVPVQPVVTQVPPYRPDVTQQPAAPLEPAVQPVDPAVRRKCLGLRGQFPSESCHKYIDCWDHVAVEHDCPPGLLFSEKGYCDYAYNVNCNNRTIIKTSTTSSCPAPHGTFRDKSNCSRYFTCIENAVAAKYECPAGLNFNDVIGVCDYAYRVDCNREPFVTQPLKNIDFLQNVPASLVEATKNCRPGRVLRLNPECTSAALCRNTVTEVVHCPVGLAYDASSDRCLPPQIARCQDS